MSRTFTLDFNKAQLKEMEEGESLAVPTGSIFTVRPSAFNITPDARGISVENRDKISVIFYVTDTMPAGTVIELELFSRVYQGALGTVTKTLAVGYTDELAQIDIEDPLLSEADYVKITYKFQQGTAYTVSKLLANVKKKLTSLTESAQEWKGFWNANTNTPALASGIGTNGDTYRVNVAGSTNLDGITDWKVGDWLVFNGDTVTWEKADNTDAVASVFSRIGAVVAAASDYDASQIDNDSGVVGTFVKDALDRLAGPAVLSTGSTVLTASDSGKIYATIPGGSDDPIVFDLPAATTVGYKFSFFSAASKPMQLAANGSEIFYVPTWHTAPNKIQVDVNFGFLSIMSTGMGSWIILTAGNKWKDADVVTATHRYDGNTHDGFDLIYDTDLGGHVFTTLAQRARGSLTISGGLPVADETFVVNGTTITAKADGSSNIDWFTIGGTVAATLTNILATLAECSEAANLTAWSGGVGVAVIEWNTPGVAGNAIVFTEAMSFTTVDGGGTLGGTHAGIEAATLLDIDENGPASIKYPLRGATSLWWHHHEISAFSVSPGGSGATFVPPDGNTLGGYQLNADTEYLYTVSNVHSDWDGASDVYVDVTFDIRVADPGGGGNTVDLQLLVYPKGTGDAVTKLQTLENAVDIDGGAQWQQYTTRFAIDYDAGGGNQVDPGDTISIRLNLETDTSEVDDVTINKFDFFYKTSKVAEEI